MPSASSGHAGPARASEQAAKRAKVVIKPYADIFSEEENEGQGDCAYIATAQGLHNLSPTTRKPDESSFKPRGHLQASLRMLVAAELSKHF